MCKLLIPVVFYVLYQSSVATADCRSTTADIVFLLDASGSMGLSNFNIQKDFVANITRAFDIGPNNVQVGLVTFSKTPYKEFDLNTNKNSTQLLTAINRVVYLFGATRTGEALKFARENSFTRAAGDRDNVTNLLVVMTDGISDFPSKTNTEVSLVKQQHIKVIAIGIGNYTDIGELHALASGPKNAFSVPSFETLYKVFDRVRDAACSNVGASSPTTTPLSVKGASGPTTTPLSVKGASSPTTTPLSAKGASGPTTTHLSVKGASSPTTTPLSAKGASGPTTTPLSVKASLSQQTTTAVKVARSLSQQTTAVVNVTHDPSSPPSVYVTKVVKNTDKAHVIVCAVLGSALGVALFISIIFRHFANAVDKVKKNMKGTVTSVTDLDP